MNRALIKLHTAVLLAGATGLFGRLMTLQEVPLVWYRVILSAIIIVCFLKISGRMEKVPAKNALHICLVGMLLSLHWVLFYASIRASNVSIGVLCCALIGVYTAVLDPFVNHKKFSWKDILFSMLTLTGLLFIYSFDSRYRTGIIIGAISSLVAAFFSMTTKKLTSTYSYSSNTLLMYEMIGGVVFLTLVMPFFVHSNLDAGIIPTWKDLMLLLVLAGLCTVVQYFFQFESLKTVSTFTVTLTYNLEPIYSIIFAMALFGEARELNYSFYIGLTLIICAVVFQNRSAFRRKTQVF